MKAFMSSCIFFFGVIAVAYCIYITEDEVQPTRYEGRVGGFVVFNCESNSLR